MSKSFEGCQHVDHFDESFEPPQTPWFPAFPVCHLTSDNSVIGSDSCNSSLRQSSGSDTIRDTMLARRENNCDNLHSLNIHYLSFSSGGDAARRVVACRRRCPVSGERTPALLGPNYKLVVVALLFLRFANIVVA